MRGKTFANSCYFSGGWAVLGQEANFRRVLWTQRVCLIADRKVKKDTITCFASPAYRACRETWSCNSRQECPFQLCEKLSCQVNHYFVGSYTTLSKPTIQFWKVKDIFAWSDSKLVRWGATSFNERKKKIVLPYHFNGLVLCWEYLYFFSLQKNKTKFRRTPSFLKQAEIINQTGKISSKCCVCFFGNILIWGIVSFERKESKQLKWQLTINFWRTIQNWFVSSLMCDGLQANWGREREKEEKSNCRQMHWSQIIWKHPGKAGLEQYGMNSPGRSAQTLHFIDSAKSLSVWPSQ